MKKLMLSFWLLTLLTAKISEAQSSLKPAISKIIEKEYNTLETFYKHLHANPELSYGEEKTAALLADKLKKLNFEVTTNIGGHGVVGILKNGNGPVVMIRTDMDALPIREQTGLSFASKVVANSKQGENIPVMHACGHDMHMTVWTGVAKVLAELKDKWKGTIMLIAQPAEEHGTGARDMLKDGLFTRFPKPDYALALHVNSNLEAGKVGYCAGYALANNDVAEIIVKGKGGHGAVPHFTIDPIAISAQIVLALQSITGREIASTDPAVITVGAINGGTKASIIPHEVRLKVSYRSLEDEVQKALLQKIKRTVEGIALSAGVARADLPEVKVLDEHIPSLYNQPELAARIGSQFDKVFGKENVVRLIPEMFGEDFAMYGREGIPAFMYSLGSVPKERMEASRRGEILLPSTHSPTYFPHLQHGINIGIMSMSSAVLLLLGGENNQAQ